VVRSARHEVPVEPGFRSEHGVDLRYIQSMPGHESSKTIEIYTHITTKEFDKIISPLENSDI
jgi:integrase